MVVGTNFSQRADYHEAVKVAPQIPKRQGHREPWGETRLSMQGILIFHSALGAVEGRRKGNLERD
jgi:hypothetical protein